MKKSTMVCLVLAVALTVGGLLLCILGTAMGGTAGIKESIQAAFPNIRINGQHAVTSSAATQGGETVQGMPTQQPTAFVLETGGVEVEMETGDSFAVKTENADCTSTVENGVWRLQLAATGRDGKAIITMPSHFAVQSVSLSAGGSDVSLRDITTADLQVELGAGKVQLEHFLCTGDAAFSVGAGKLVYTGVLENNITVDCGAGKVDIETPRPENYGYNVSVGMGKVDIGGESYNGIADAKVRTDEHPLYTVSVGMGKVTIVFTKDE